ncbi:MAG TPA: helix-turn-helix transcriptional regulator [Ktedonobacteraceae bacterium]|nr:helix-turn-helix transcriptional regulator [Ktedonobacteraceae bacterium]
MKDHTKRPNTKLRYQRECRGWSQRKVAALIGTSKEMVSRWECGERETSPYYQEKLCALFHMSAEELGFVEDPSNLNAYRRKFIGTALEIAGITLVNPVLLLPESPSILTHIEEALPLWESSLKTFWQLYFNGGIPVIEQALPSLLSQLAVAAQSSSKEQKRVASLASQAYQMSWLLALQRQDFGQALSSINYAYTYAQMAEDVNLLLASLVRQAHIYYHLANPVQQLLIHEQAMQFAPAAHPLLCSWLYLLLAENHAHLQHAKEAETFLDLAKKTLPNEDARRDPHFSFVSMNHFLITNFEVISLLHLQQPHKALDMLTHLGLSAADPRCSELLNHKLMIFYTLDDMEQSAQWFAPAVQMAKQANSRLRYNEVCRIYGKMIAKWPKEQKIKELATLLR